MDRPDKIIFIALVICALSLIFFMIGFLRVLNYNYCPVNYRIDCQK
jgi:hypothetical protein